MINEKNIDKAIDIAISIKRQFKNPTMMSRRSDDWKLDTMRAQLDRIVNILKGGEDVGINTESASITPMDSQDGIISEEPQ